MKRASAVLGYDLDKFIDTCSETDIEDTLYAQPALFVCSIIAYESIDKTYLNQYKKIYAGLSLGEYTCMVANGILSFEDGLSLVHARANLMKKAALSADGSMSTIVGKPEADVQSYCDNWNHKEKQKVYIANYLFPNCVVVSGSRAGVEYVENNCKDAIKITKNRVSGAFHTEYMSCAYDKLKEKIFSITWKECDISSTFSNVTGKQHLNATYKEQLCEQLIKPVRWAETLAHFKGKQCIEVGPGEQITAMLKRVDMKTGVQCMKKTNELFGMKL
jgi:[acyl-carrier-protein] S-malonyltransferase